METMYAGKVNSPATILDGAIDNTVTTINVIDGSVLPTAPNIAVIGVAEDAETILYVGKTANQLTSVTRGYQGVAKAWDSGETIARMFTEYDYASLKANIGEIAARKLSAFAATTSAELATTISDEVGEGKAVFGIDAILGRLSRLVKLVSIADIKTSIIAVLTIYIPWLKITKGSANWVKTSKGEGDWKKVSKK